LAAKKKTGNYSIADNTQHFMKIVTSDTCMACKQQCPRGLAYIDKMSQLTGAIGYGVPCILTKGKNVVEKKAGKKK
jgi:hypothetical protein